MEIDKGGANKLARSIVLHARQLEFELEMEREKVRELKVKNDERVAIISRYKWHNAREFFAMIFDKVAAIIFGLLTLGIGIWIFPIYAYGAVIVLTDLWTRGNSTLLPASPFQKMYDLAGCAFGNVIYPRFRGNVVIDTWFYLFNGTVNKSLCF
jgi:hypothetical protein